MTTFKLDVKGAEFDVFPAALEDLPAVHTWVIEIHPIPGRGLTTILDLFRARGYYLHWSNRRAARIEPWPAGATWGERTSLIALRS